MRTCQTTSDAANVLGVWMTGLGWKNIAVVTSDDSYAADFGEIVANTMVSLFHGTFPELDDAAGDAAVNATAMKHVLPLAQQAKASGARIIFVLATLLPSNRALLLGLQAAGCLEEGFAVVSESSQISMLVGTGGTPLVDGLVLIKASKGPDCLLKDWCPPAESAIAKQSESLPLILAQAHDAVVALSLAVAPLINSNDGGAAYLAGSADSRRAAMTTLRSLNLASDTAASGPIQFAEGTNNRNKWNFRYKITNVRWEATPDGERGGSTATILGEVTRSGFKWAHGITQALIRWPGRTNMLPAVEVTSRVVSTRNIASVGCLFYAEDQGINVTGSWKQTEQYLMQAISAAEFLGTDTTLVLERGYIYASDLAQMTGKSRAALIAETFAAIEARARQANRPVVAFLATTSEFAIAALDSSDPLLRGIPFIGLETDAVTLGDSARYPSFVSLWPGRDVSYHALIKLSVEYQWTSLAVFGDMNDLQDVALVRRITDVHGSGSTSSDLTAANSTLAHPSRQVTISQAELINFTSTQDLYVSRMLDLMDKAKKLNIRVFYLCMAFETAQVMLRALQAAGLSGKGYQVLFADASVQHAARIASADADTRMAFDGALTVRPRGFDVRSLGYVR